MNDRISSLRLFVRVARTGSFTAAGKEVGLSQPSASRIISKLEEDLGAALFVRSTHAVKLTEAGSDYLRRLDPILAALEEADHLVSGDGELRGHLRVGAATSFAIREIIPRLPAFKAMHPELRIDLVSCRYRKRGFNSTLTRVGYRQCRGSCRSIRRPQCKGIGSRFRGLSGEINTRRQLRKYSVRH
jgi:DNA-binding transcriptional LysR family regulator